MLILPGTEEMGSVGRRRRPTRREELRRRRRRPIVWSSRRDEPFFRDAFVGRLKQSAATRVLLQNFCFYVYVYLVYIILVSLFIYLFMFITTASDWGGYSQSARKGDRTCDPPMRRSTSHSSSNQYPIRISLRQAAYN